MPVNDAVYTREWFESHYAFAGEYAAVADVIHECFARRIVSAGLAKNPPGKRQTVVDVGCGLGLIIHQLQQHGWVVTGIDGSPIPEVIAPLAVRGRIVQSDLTVPPDPLSSLARYDLVICTEVGEHLATLYADTLVQHCVRRSAWDGYIVFSGATPGQGGTDHVNEQPHEYWIDKFAAQHKTLARTETNLLQSKLANVCPNMPWFYKNSLVFA